MLIWIIISLGIYQCGVHMENNDTDMENSAEDEKTNEEEGIENDNSDSNPFDKDVRILIMNQGYQGIYHTELQLSCSEGMTVENRGKVTEYAPESKYTLTLHDLTDSETIRISGRNGGRICIENIERNGPVQYRGVLDCYSTDKGIVVINELPVEEYLYGVVPSEMPSSYPQEALKAQAISARTYTYFHKQTYVYPQWRAHMDDSTVFQVYGNCEETQNACMAVDETQNQVLTYEGAVVESFYYSTSGGYNGGAGVWKDFPAKEDGYLTETGEELYAANNMEGEAAYKEYIDAGNEEDIEYYEPWYRWDYVKNLDSESVKKLLQKLYNLSLSQPQKVRIRSKYLPAVQLTEENAIKDIRILNRKKSGLVTAILLETQQFRVSILSQYTIRQAFGGAGETVTKNDGSIYTMGELLPSAYFYMEKIYDNNDESGNNLKEIAVHGAGFGHGCGMSQNGAKCLANRGLTAAQILAYYYNGDIVTVDELVAD